jgi:hypothetical protein
MSSVAATAGMGGLTPDEIDRLVPTNCYFYPQEEIMAAQKQVAILSNPVTTNMSKFVCLWKKICFTCLAAAHEGPLGSLSALSLLGSIRIV